MISTEAPPAQLDQQGGKHVNGPALCELQGSPLRLDSPLISWLQLDRAHRHATRSLDRRLAPHGLTRTSAAILMPLLSEPDGLEIRTLVEVTGLLHAGMSGALGRMERDGLCVRIAGQDRDQRAVVVQITQKGRHCLMEAINKYDSWARSCVSSDAIARGFHAVAMGLGSVD